MEFGSVNFGGLASGLDTKALIDAIINAERRPIFRLEDRQSALKQQKSAYDELRSNISSFLSTVKKISSDSTFRGRIATVSDDSYFKASAGTAAETGLFDVEVLSLAAAHKIASNGVAAADQPLVADGTITIQSGSNTLFSLDVSSASANNTLESVRDAINASDSGIAASILFNGTEHRLVVRADETGVANALTVTDGTNLGLDDPVNDLIAATDALITVDTVQVSSSTNTISGVIAGVTIDLLQTTTGPASLAIENDLQGVVDAVKEMVDSFNEVVGFLSQQFDREDPGPLSRDSFVRRLQGTLNSLVTSGVEGIPFGSIRSLSSIGVSFDGRSGELSVDVGELTTLLEEQFDEVGDLFLTAGSASSPFVRFLSGGTSAVGGDYAVAITQAAEQGTLVGAQAIRAQGLANNETLTISVNGQDVVVNLLQNQTIDDVVIAVNGALTAAGASATASDDGGALRISSNDYGSDQSISVLSDQNNQATGEQSGFDTTAANDSGLDVAGTIDGLASSGAGRALTATDPGNASGISLLITATAADVTAAGGDFGTLSFNAGLTRNIISELSETTRIGDGRIDSTQSGIDDQLRVISDSLLRLEERLSKREGRLIRQFAAAERAISLLQSQQNSLLGFIPPS